MTEKKLINIRVTAEEDALLTSYAEATGRTKTDIVRELIRSLKKKLDVAQQNKKGR
jgi:predicted DNA-binding protein